MKKITIDGNEACSLASYLFTDIAGIYPITPSSPMAEHIEKWSNEGKKNLFGNIPKVVEMQSEAGAAGFIHGALQVGSLASTYTASQGLLLMIPNMYKIAGEMLPLVIHVASRSLATHALSIFGDHQDIYAARATGFAFLASSSVQDAYFMSGLAHLCAIKSSIPHLHFFDGFRTSHEINKINILEEEKWESLIDYKAITNFRSKALIPNNVLTRGTAQNDDIYFQNFESRNIHYEKEVEIVKNYMEKLNKLAGTNYKPFNYYGGENAKRVIIAMGSVCETIKETLDEDTGLIEVHLYRPFDVNSLKEVLPKSVTDIAVLDRTKEIGSQAEPLYLDVTNALKDTNINIIGGRYGLSSKNTTPNDILAVFENLKKNKKDHFTISIIDDVTNTSLEVKNKKFDNKTNEYLIYGYGSDGMVSASKSMIKIVGDYTDKYVQGYFQYDSKKSGGVTISHLRFSDEVIKSTYYVSNPIGIAITKDTYIKDFINIENIKEKGFILINTSKDNKELEKYLPDDFKKIVLDKKIKIYKIDAYKIANNLGLGNKISTIIESIMIKLMNVIDYDLYVERIKEDLFTKFDKKGSEIVKANYQAVDLSNAYLEEFNLDSDDIIILDEKKEIKNITKAVSKRLGDNLPVSAFDKVCDGTFVGGNTKTMKKNISDIVPSWIKDNCIECGMCAMLCPHSVIKLYLLDDEEFNNAPDYVKRRCIQPIEKNLQSYYFCIGISIKNCTGCGICVKACPGRNGEKALEKEDIIKEIKDNSELVSDYLYNNVKEKDADIKNLIKKYNLKKSKFLYPGACAGCGETPYIKLLTQMFDNLVIANATGCSSIYGGSSPETPYQIPWSNSLFEDNAEYGFGIVNGVNQIKEQIKNLMLEEIEKNDKNKSLYENWIKNSNDYKITKQIYEDLDYSIMSKNLASLKNYITSQTTFIIGGDGWAYDIGFSGIDHVLASGENVNILVLDTQVYSNTGGQSSKSTNYGAVALFNSKGKETDKKDLAHIFMGYKNVYVAQIALQANQMQTIKAIEEAVNYDGPSIILAYCPCISHGIKGGMENSMEYTKLAVESGYYPLFRRDPRTKFSLDSKANFNKYDEFLQMQTRYKMLYTVNSEKADVMLKENKKLAIERYEYYEKLGKES